MYITNTSNGINQINCPVCTEQPPIKCPPICERQFSLYFNLLGIAFGLSCLIVYLVRKRIFPRERTRRKKIFSQILFGLFWTLVVLFTLYFLKFEYRSISDECSTEGIFVSGRLLPDFDHPLYSRIH